MVYQIISSFSSVNKNLVFTTGNKVQKPASKEAYRTKYRSLRRHLKTIIKNVQNKPGNLLCTLKKIFYTVN